MTKLKTKVIRQQQFLLVGLNGSTTSVAESSKDYQI